MNFKHLYYYISIVNNEFNLSRTAEKLYISQSTLSIAIKRFESEEGVTLFNRNKNRIVSLTEKGERYYEDSLQVMDKLKEMKQNLHKKNDFYKGEITIGLPPIFSSLLLKNIMFNLIDENPGVTFKFVERGVKSLSEMLVLGKIDIAFLLDPDMLSNNIIESYPVKSSEIVLFMSQNHTFANKKNISWVDLHKRKLALLDDTFKVTQYVKEKLIFHNVFPNIILQTPSLDFLLNLVIKNPELITIAAYPTIEVYPLEGVIAKRINNPIPWVVKLTRLKKHNYTKIENTIFNSLIEKLK